MEAWLSAALDYIPRWIAFQMRLTGQPGCALAVAYKGRVVLERAFGSADLGTGKPLTSRHRFRVASHSKTFTAAGVLKLREQGLLQLDQPLGQFVAGLHPGFAQATLGQLLSHSAGTVRDGADAGQWQDRRPFLNEAQLRADLASGPVIPADSRFKYSNHGFALAGLAIEAVTGEPYRDWIAREIVAASGLTETLPDAPAPRGTPFARGHTGKLPLGRRLVIPGDNPTNALAAATGFVSTAADLARFYGSLSPLASNRVLSADSRRAMAKRQWRDPHSSLERWYGLGTISGSLADWEWMGHSGGFQGYITISRVVPAQDLSLSVLTNAVDGTSHLWMDGALHILRAFQRNGAPSRRTAPWTGRWWSLWGATDLLPMGDKVLVANPALGNPLQDASEISVLKAGRDGMAHGQITLAGGYASHGEPARLVRGSDAQIAEVWLGGNRLMPQTKVARELARRYQAAK